MTGEQASGSGDFWANVQAIVEPLVEPLSDGVDRLVEHYEVTDEQGALYCLEALAEKLGLPERGDLLLPGEVAREFGVSSKTVARWAKTGKIRHIKTPGGHRRFPSSEVMRLTQTADLRGSDTQDPES